MAKCVFCGGELRHEDNTTYTNTIDLAETQGRMVHIVVFGVPAEVCQRCGEKEFSGEVADKLLAFAKTAEDEAAAKFVKGRLIYTYEGQFGELPAFGSASQRRKAS